MHSIPSTRNSVKYYESDRNLNNENIIPVLHQTFSSYSNKFTVNEKRRQKV